MNYGMSTAWSLPAHDDFALQLGREYHSGGYYHSDYTLTCTTQPLREKRRAWNHWDVSQATRTPHHTHPSS